MYQERFYQKDFSRQWNSYEVNVKETELFVQSKGILDTSIIQSTVQALRSDVEAYIERFPVFATGLSSFSLQEPAPRIVKEMIEKTSLVDVGPMASVAGAVAEYIGKELMSYSPEVMVENGGDIFIAKRGDVVLGLYAGQESVINDFLISVHNKEAFFGVCSSSSVLGHSLSLGRADLVTVISPSVIFADALATKLANMVIEEEDIDKALEFSRTFSYTKAVVIVRKERIGLWGDIELLRK